MQNGKNFAPTDVIALSCLVGDFAVNLLQTVEEEAASGEEHVSLKLLALTFDNTSRHRFWRLRPDKFASVWFVIRVTQFLSLNFHHLSLKIPKFSKSPN